MSHRTSGILPQQTHQFQTTMVVKGKASRGHGHEGHGKMKFEPVKLKSKKKTKSKSEKKTKVRQANEPSKETNSWLTFRSYYQGSFTNFQQKEISGLLSKLWQEDPFKGKWTIIAKSYSRIRDSVGKKNAPLDKFLEISCSLMAIIEPTQYFVIMGWEVASDEDGGFILRRNEKPIDASLFANTFSVNDVICHSYNQGYFTGNLDTVLLAENEAAMAMATTMQPTVSDLSPLPDFTETHRDNTDRADYLGNKDVNGDEGILGVLDSANSATDELTPLNDMNEVAQEAAPEMGATDAALATENAVVSTSESPGSSELPTAEAVASPIVTPSIDVTALDVKGSIKNDAWELQNGHYELETEFPFNEEFDPAASAFTFDPFWGNQFDVFDVSEFNDFVVFPEDDDEE